MESEADDRDFGIILTMERILRTNLIMNSRAVPDEEYTQKKDIQSRMSFLMDDAGLEPVTPHT